MEKPIADVDAEVNYAKAVEKLDVYKRLLNERFRGAQRRGENTKALEALRSAAHQNTPFECKRKMIIFKSKVQRGTYELPDHEMDALNSIIHHMKYINLE
ncbi:MAG: hypothetical protein QF755_04280 [Candidatus Peribacteraceae bacterium]|jgi:hypothetical protein|nr:hypothetical protein [Candidatus Peribacteraceae bacterium]